MAQNHKRAARSTVPLGAQSTARLEARLEMLLQSKMVREAVEAVMISAILQERQDQPVVFVHKGTDPNPTQVSGEPVELPSGRMPKENEGGSDGAAG